MSASTDPAPRDVLEIMENAGHDQTGCFGVEDAQFMLDALAAEGYVLVRGDGLRHGDELEPYGIRHWRRRSVGGSQP
jgi:hypothetical protein